MLFTNKYAIIFLWILIIPVSCKDNITDDTPKDTTGWKLVWSDEFDYTGALDSTKWGYDIGASGWGNNELQYYSSDPVNARAENGMMIIEAIRYEDREPAYSSARVVSRGKRDWTYGRFEIRVKLPSGRGTWPAIWMLPTEWNLGNGGWPDNGEIDIMEHVGYDPGKVHASTHCHTYNWPNNTQKTSTINIPDAQDEFHSYIMEWYPEKIDMYVDSVKYFTSTNDGTGWEAWPFNKDFHLILNIAVGGNWGGAQGIDTTIFPQKMEIDYVRVYKWQE
jgi:beta-glucanase (GH16 family)